jgi:hypothetical protein
MDKVFTNKIILFCHNVAFSRLSSSSSLVAMREGVSRLALAPSSRFGAQ